MSRFGKFNIFLIIILTGVLLSMNPIYASEDKPTCDASLAAFSQYIWRGYEFSKDSIVVFPSLTVSYKGFGFNVWGDLDTRFVGATNDNDMEMFETDYTLTYKNSYEKLKYTFGWVYYDVDGGEDQEVFVSLGLDTFLSPEISVYRGIEHTDAWYVKFALSHSFELSNKWSLVLGGWVSYYDIPDGDLITGGDYHEWHDATVWVSLTIPINDWCTLTPSLNYSFPLSSGARDQIETTNQAFARDKESEFLYGGVTLAVTF